MPARQAPMPYLPSAQRERPVPRWSKLMLRIWGSSGAIAVCMLSGTPGPPWSNSSGSPSGLLSRTASAAPGVWTISSPHTGQPAARTGRRPPEANVSAMPGQAPWPPAAGSCGANQARAHRGRAPCRPQSTRLHNPVNQIDLPVLRGRPR
jgi:hypothetical protein